MSNDYPFGTIIIIDGIEYVCEDRGGYIVDNRVDIYVETEEEALELGRQIKIGRIKNETE